MICASTWLVGVVWRAPALCRSLLLRMKSLNRNQDPHLRWLKISNVGGSANTAGGKSGEILFEEEVYRHGFA